MRIKFLMVAVTGCMLICSQRVSAQNCAPTGVTVTPATCADRNDGSISVTPQPCGEKCYEGVPTPVTDCSSCSQTYQGSNLNITVNANQKVCILGNSSVSNVSLNGGTLVVCGSTTFQNWINMNVPATIVIIGSASFNNGGINLSHASAKLYNYGTLSLAYNLTIQGEVHNYGTATVNSDLNINDPTGKLYNYKTINAKASLNNGERLENRGTITVGTNSNSHKLQLNSSSYTLNACTINVTGDALVNASSLLDHRGRFTVSRDMVVNGNSTIQMSGGTKIKVNRNFTGESGILSRVGGSGCSLIETMGHTLFNAGMLLRGNLAYCNRGSISGNPQRQDGAVLSCTTCFPPDSPPQETFSISWTGPGGVSLSGPQISNLAPGNYQMTLTCGSCTYNNTYSITAPSALTVSVSLNADKTGATASASGGTGPYIYTWTGPVSGTGAVLNNLVPGAYTLTATDASNCEATTTFDIPAAKCNPEIDQSPISCFGANDGQITIVNAGCASPQILWLESGSTLPTLSNLGPGVYHARIVCEGVCIDTAVITLTEPTALVLTTSTGIDGIVTLTSSGGTGVHTYGWYAGSTLLSSANNSAGLPPGTYEARVTDERGCTDSETVDVTGDGTSCTPHVTVTHITCEVMNGKLEADTTSLCSSAIITWTNNTGHVVGTGPVLYASAGVYTITVLCEDCTYSNDYTINAVPPLTISAQVTGNTARVLVTGGTMPYLFQWTNNGRIVSTDQSPEVLPAGVNKVLVVDANGCSDETSVTLNTPACTPEVDITPVSCNGSEDGSITVTNPGCPEDEEPSSGCTEQPVTPPADQLCNCGQLISGNNVNVDVYGSKVCIANNTNVNSITFHGTGTAVVCGSASIGGINFNNAGKLVLHGNTTIGNMNFNGNNGFNGSVYNYGNLTFTGGFSAAGIVYNHKNMTVNGDLNINDNRGKFYNTGTVVVKASLNNNEILENSGTITVGVNPLTHKIHLNGGSYTVNACTMSTVGELLMDASSVLEYRSEITVGTKLTIQGGSTLRLYGGNKINANAFTGQGTNSKIELTGTSCARITVQGKTELKNFTISGQISYCDLTPNQADDLIENSSFINGAGQNCVCNPGQSTGGSATFTWFGVNADGPSATGLGQGTYSVGIHCPGTCYSIHDYTVPAPPPLVVDFTVSGSGLVDTEVTGGTPFTSGEPYIYAWTSNNGTTVPPVPDPQLPAPGDYTLLVTDAKNCSTTVTVTWDSPPCDNSPIVNITDESCGLGRDGKIEIVDPRCGSGDVTYVWSGPGIMDANRNVQSPDKLIAGTYTLKMTCGTTCMSTYTYEIRAVSAINIKSISVSSELSCNQAFDGALTVVAEGGSGDYNYEWSDSWKVVGENSPILSGITAGIYYVTVTDKNGESECTGKGSFTLGADEDCYLCTNGDIHKKDLTCASVPDGELEVVMNDNGTYIFAWNTGETTAKITNLDAGIYTVRVTHTFNGDQCYMRTFLNEPEGFAVDILGDTMACQGENIRLEAVSASPASLTWSPANPAGINNPVYVTTTPGTYTVTATWGSCTETASVTVVAAPAAQCGNCEGGNLEASVTGTNLTCNASGDGRAEVLVTGGSDVYTYIWSTGSQDRILRDVPAGSYSVSVTDRVLNCTVTEEVTITQPNPLQITIDGDSYVCHASTTLLSAVGSPGTYTWTKIGSNEIFPNEQTINVSTGGTFVVEVRSPNGLCTARSNDFKLTQQPAKPTIYRSRTKMCPGDTIELRASVPDNITWSTGETTQTIFVTQPGTYTVNSQPGNCQPTMESVTITLKAPEECEEPSLCEPQFTTPVVLDNPCIQEATTRAEQRARERWEEYIDAQRKDFQHQYIAKCIQTQEELTVKYTEQEYHYTLFYYDQAGNLVRSVPPKGVNIITDTAVLTQIQQERAAGNARTVETSHTYMTTYQYNSNNQATGHLLPDHVPMGNNSKISEHNWYDELGRPVLIQTSFHYAQNPRRYQYVLYDDLGRELENGEVRTNDSPDSIQSPDSEYKVVTSKLIAWLAPLQKYEVHRNYYDTVTFSIPGFVQENLRNRMAAATYEVRDEDNNPMTYDNAIHYSYDVHGNVKEQVTDYPELEPLLSRYKFVTYVYDLVTQNILETHYQKGRHDQFFYRNEYDEDNRLVQTWTSKDYIHWDRDVKQFFYDHGPVARTELGHEKVQGVDYAHTIQGWVKAANSNTLTPERDMGKDGLPGTLHRYIPQDEMGYSLGFYKGDYSSIGNSSFLINTSGSELESANRDLYNGNISSLITSINQFMKDGQGPLAQTFNYDQLNRLKESRAYEDPNSVNSNTWSASGTATQKYMTKYTYDANGNILTLKRNAHVGTTAEGDGLDDLVYQYENNTNKLISVEERRDNSGNPELQELDDIKP